MTLVHSRLAALAVAVTGAVAVAAPGCSTSNDVAGRAEAGTSPPGAPSTPVVEPEGGVVPSGDAAVPSEGTIGPAGGTLGIGSATITIPPGALDHDVDVSLRPIAALLAGAYGEVVQIEPSGTVFAVPATVTLSYADRDLGGQAPTAFAVATVAGNAWQPLASEVVDVDDLTISGVTMHLSPFALVAATSAPSTDGGTPADSTVPSDGSAEPVVLGTGGPCAPSGAATVGTKVTVNTTWPASAAVSKGAGPVSVWLLSTYDVAGNGSITGTITTCGMQLPVITFSALGDQAMGVPGGQTGQQQIVIPDMSWSGVPLADVTGMLGGWNVGSSIAIDPVVMLYGLSGTSALASGSATWPASESAIAPGDLTYANGTAYAVGTGVPGIVATYDGAPPDYLPTTSLAPGSPTATAASLVLRVQLRLYGTSTSCTAQSGQAFVSDLNGRIVGCNLSGGGGPCSVDQYGFLDSNEAQFVPGAGTFVSRQLASGASCSDVLAALP